MVEAFSALLAERLSSLEGTAGALRPAAVARAAPVRRPAAQQDRQLQRLHHSLLKQEAEVRPGRRGQGDWQGAGRHSCSNRRPR